MFFDFIAAQAGLQELGIERIFFAQSEIKKQYPKG